MAVLACQSLGLIDVGGIGSIEGDPQKYESPVNHLGLLGALQAAQGAANAPCKVDVMVVAFKSVTCLRGW